MTAQRSMRMILAAVADPAASGQVAARKAIELAWLMDARVLLYHACYDPSLAGGAFFDTPRLAAARKDYVGRAVRAMEAVAADVAEADVAVSVRAEWQRHIPEAIATAAIQEGADMVVAEPRFRAAGRRRGLSATDWDLARCCPLPLLLARSAAPYSSPVIIAAVDPGRHSARVSSLDIGIVGIAARLAADMAGSVKVIHCLHVPPVVLSSRNQGLRRERARVTEMVRHIARDAGIARRSVRVVDGPPAQALLEAVASEGADMLVLGTVVRGALARLVMGSTTERLLHEAPCDLLLVRPDGVRRVLRRRAVQ